MKLQVHKTETRTYIGSAFVSTADILAGNGVVHIVDNMLGGTDFQKVNGSVVSINATTIRLATQAIGADFFDEDQVRTSTWKKHVTFYPSSC